MSDGRCRAVVAMLQESARLHEQAAQAAPAVVAAADLVQMAVSNGGKVLIFGNGGSAADAQHFSCELIGRFTRDRRALPAIALCVDTSSLTAIANDYGFDRVFVRQIEALGSPGDVAIGITTSGASPNVLAGLQCARSRGLKTIAFTGGNGGAAAEAADVHVNVPISATPRIQEVHRTLIHAVCELVESGLVSPSASNPEI